MGYVRVNDTEIYYEVHGKGEPLAFFNGIFMSTQSFSPILPNLIKKYTVLLHDFRGQWNSQKNGDKFSLELHSNDFCELLKALKIEKINIVGVSYGGEVALKFSTLFPEKVKSLIIVSSVSEIDDELKKKINRWIEGANTKVAQKFIDSWLKDVYSPQFLQNYENFLINKLKDSLKTFDYEASFKLMNSFLELYENPITKDLKNISIPTLVVAGEFDTLKPIKFSKIIHNNIKNSELLIIGDSGHAIPIEKRNEFETVIYGFLEKINFNERS